MDVSSMTQTDDVKRSIKRASSRTKILSPLVNPPTLQPVDCSTMKQEQPCQDSVINTLITLDQKHQPVVMASPTN